jgi:hypothetical protein
MLLTDHWFPFPLCIDSSILGKGQDTCVFYPSPVFDIYLVRMFQVNMAFADSRVLMHSQVEHMSPSWSQLLPLSFTLVVPHFLCQI